MQIRNTIIGSLCLLLFYVLIQYYILGGVQLNTTIFILVIGLLLAMLPTGFLSSTMSGLSNYRMDQVFLAVALVQIMAIIGFIFALLVTSVAYFSSIAPLTGHLIFGLSFILQAAIVIPHRSERWLQIGSGLYLITYVLFSLWQYMSFGILAFVFVYVVLYNISVLSYGVLQYYLKLQTKYTETVEMET